MMKLFLICNSFFFFLCAFFFGTAHAQLTVTETQMLSFGTFSIPNFNNVARMNIRNNGTGNPNGNLVIIVNPTRGEYDLSDPANPNSNYTVVPDTTSVNISGPGGVTFLVDNFRIRPNTLRTNAAGFDRFRLAARITSQGGGVVYPNGVYSGTIDLTISF